jgi:hypothetical protein
MVLGNLTEEQKKEANEYFNYFLEKLPNLLKEHPWEYALIRGKEPMEFYKSFKIASVEGFNKYGLEKMFIIQRVEPKPPTNFIFNEIFKRV